MNIDEVAEKLFVDVTKSDKVDKKVNKYSLPGRGRKLCPQCQSYIGVRTFKCECGYDFHVGESPAPLSTADKNSKYDEPITDEDKRYALAVGLANGGVMVYGAAGICPSVLDKDSNYEIVAQFCEDVVADGVSKKKLYMPSAIKHWIHYFIDANSDEYKEASKMVDRWYDEKVTSTMEIEV